LENNWYVADTIAASDVDARIISNLGARREAFAGATGEGFDVKVVGEILRLRKQDRDERDERDSLLDLYLRAMESVDASQANAA
jgi:hypothetical protein